MTNDQDSNCDDSFQVVLIDIKKTAREKIHCVKKPLTEELKYVAISYRWGELHESIIDTGVGYSASITSFALYDFYQLCDDIINDSTMASIRYVWVDAICVNQLDPDERKKTIYHMSDIYKLATWILAVPDLHAEHLKAMHRPVMNTVFERKQYLYHLLHGHTDKLHEIDDKFLGDIGVPQDANLRQLLTKYTDSFADGFMTPVKPGPYYNHIHAIDHLYKNNNKTSGIQQMIPGKTLRTQPGIEPPHQCDEVDCPLDYLKNLSKGSPSEEYRSGEWDRRIIERRTAIKATMEFLTALVVDWSSRVWVISEFHLAKKKNNLRFWFNQLHRYHNRHQYNTFSFFNFDMNDSRFTTIQNTFSFGSSLASTDAVYHVFYHNLVQRLNRQTFLEMMLKSKASKNEDRFHAIFPFFPHYKHLLQKEELGNMKSILDVKLKLYKVMTNKDKLLLLYLSYNGKRSFVSPTFATSAIRWPEQVEHVDFTHTTHVTLEGHYLRVKPTNYTITRNFNDYNSGFPGTLNRLLYPKALRLIGFAFYVDVVRIDTEYTPIVLVGSFIENTWILGDRTYDIEAKNKVEELADDFPGFRVF